jgi:hypothetical protein
LCQSLIEPTFSLNSTFDVFSTLAPFYKTACISQISLLPNSYEEYSLRRGIAAYGDFAAGG